MTQEQTRQLGIEFERRIQEIYPGFIMNEKLDSDTIYSFLSQFQDQYVRSLYLADQQGERGTRQSKKLNDTVKSLVKHKWIEPADKNVDMDGYSVIFNIPEDYYMYIRSTSIIDKNYKSGDILKKPVRSSNITIKQDDASELILAFYDSKGIMRRPAVVFESTLKGSDYIKVIHDCYTDIIALDLTYYCQPYAFNVLKYNDKDVSVGAVHSTCELPFSCFEELVSGAVEMYITQYKFRLTGAGNNSRQRQQQKQQEDEQ